jgi:peroxiredoxin
MPSSATYKRPPRPSLLDATMLRHRLIGATLTADFTVQTTDREQVGLGGPIAAVVAYLFPGSTSSPDHGADTPLADAEEHRSFRDLHERLAALELIVVGVSSQPEEKLREAIAANRLCQPLASDPTLRLAERLKLPTFPAGGQRVYERLTLLIIAGRITEVFYPVPTPGRHAEEVLQRLDGR